MRTAALLAALALGVAPAAVGAPAGLAPSPVDLGGSPVPEVSTDPGDPVELGAGLWSDTLGAGSSPQATHQFRYTRRTELSTVHIGVVSSAAGESSDQVQVEAIGPRRHHLRLGHQQLVVQLPRRAVRGRPGAAGRGRGRLQLLLPAVEVHRLHGLAGQHLLDRGPAGRHQDRRGGPAGRRGVLAPGRARHRARAPGPRPGERPRGRRGHGRVRRRPAARGRVVRRRRRRGPGPDVPRLPRLGADPGRPGRRPGDGAGPGGVDVRLRAAGRSSRCSVRRGSRWAPTTTRSRPARWTTRTQP